MLSVEQKGSWEAPQGLVTGWTQPRVHGKLAGGWTGVPRARGNSRNKTVATAFEDSSPRSGKTDNRGIANWEEGSKGNNKFWDEEERGWPGRLLEGGGT